MKTSLLLLVVVSLSAAATAVSATPPRKPNAPDAVAIVCFASGPTAAWSPRPAIRREVRLFDWLLPGTRLEVGPDGRLDIAFRNGRRYHLEAGAEVTLGAEDLTASAGPVAALPSLPPLPRLAAIRPDDPAGRRVGAVRLRGERMAGLYPQDAAIPPGETTLQFDAVPTALRYLVTIEDPTGRPVFQAESESSTVPVPRGVLLPGTTYSWHVRTVDAAGWPFEGVASFATLDEQAVGEWRALKDAVERTNDLPSLVLLAEVERGLGLRAEARETLRLALEMSPDSPDLTQRAEAALRELRATDVR
jgi:hypothetical protein